MEPTESEKLINRIKALLESEENTTFFSTERNDQLVVFAFCDWLGIKEPTQATLEDCQDSYQGEFSTMTHFAEHLVDETGFLDDMPENLQSYFDYEKFGRDLELGGDYYFSDNHGFVFSSNW